MTAAGSYIQVIYEEYVACSFLPTFTRRFYFKISGINWQGSETFAKPCHQNPVLSEVALACKSRYLYTHTCYVVEMLDESDGLLVHTYVMLSQSPLDIMGGGGDSCYRFMTELKANI